MTATNFRQELKSLSNPNQAFELQRFFKTGPGQYGEGDIFWGIKVPLTRDVVKKYRKMPLNEISQLITDPVHEVRMGGGFLLVEYYKQADTAGKKACYDFYISNASRFNNWDLVDMTCHHIVGNYLWDKDRKPLYKLAVSESLWEQRISIISTFHFIRKDDFNDSFEIAKMLLNHKHDLIQKAVGWMLREIGKRNPLAETEFLVENDRYMQMPRTMLRYAIEKYPEKQRQAFLKGEF
ncbi:MAG: DNA alkylation repair protein [Bacteroidales bacterium]|nr:DNA alkylation repair protein [Bacteroidales bacterium]